MRPLRPFILQIFILFGLFALPVSAETGSASSVFESLSSTKNVSRLEFTIARLKSWLAGKKDGSNLEWENAHTVLYFNVIFPDDARPPYIAVYNKLLFYRDFPANYTSEEIADHNAAHLMRIFGNLGDPYKLDAKGVNTVYRVLGHRFTENWFRDPYSLFYIDNPAKEVTAVTLGEGLARSFKIIIEIDSLNGSEKVKFEYDFLSEYDSQYEPKFSSENKRALF